MHTICAQWSELVKENYKPIELKRFKIFKSVPKSKPSTILPYELPYFQLQRFHCDCADLMIMMMKKQE